MSKPWPIVRPPFRRPMPTLQPIRLPLQLVRHIAVAFITPMVV